MTTPKRTLRTPAERAIAALGVEQRRVEKLEAKHKDLSDQADAVWVEMAAAKRRLEYLQANPDLPEADTDPIPGIDGES